MEFWGLGLLVALWRYFREVDWDLRVKRKPSKGRNRPRTDAKTPISE
jgi:hypothetical protein